MAEQHLDLFQLATCGPAQFGASTSQVMGPDAVKPDGLRVFLEGLPNNLLRHPGALHPITSVDTAEDASVGNTR